MQRRWGIACWAVAFWIGIMWWSLPVQAAPGDPWRSGTGAMLSGSPASPLEAQMLGERPAQSPSAADKLFSTGLSVDSSGGATLKLPKNVELHISFLYNRDNRDQTAAEPPRRVDSPLLFNYSMDYRLLPNLQVGMSGYLYYPSEDGFAFPRLGGDRVLGLGPGIRYDLGRWSFVLKSQLETGKRNEGMQNWFRVWYAF